MYVSDYGFAASNSVWTTNVVHIIVRQLLAIIGCTWGFSNGQFPVIRVILSMRIMCILMAWSETTMRTESLLLCALVFT